MIIEPVSLMTAAWLATLFGAANMVIWFGNSLRRELRGLPERAIAEAMDGERVRISGDASCAPGTGELLTAPLSGRQCLGYSLIVMRQDLGGRWIEHGREERSVEILVRDGTGVVAVELARARFDTETTRWPGFARSHHPRPPLIEALLRENPAGLTRALHAVERVLLLGRVTIGGVMGHEAHVGGATDGYREAPRRAVLRSTQEMTLIVSQR